MNRFLPFYSLNRFVCLAFIGIFQLAFSATAWGQHPGNLLSNGSFETPAVTILNGNNIMGPGVTWGGWSCTNGGLNIIRVQGSGYASGANMGAEGNQYVDVANSDGYIYQQFTLSVVSPVSYNGSFSNRESGWSSYVNWTGRIDILDSVGTVVSTSTNRNFITTDDNEAWYTLTGVTSPLPAGKYTYRAYAGNSGHFDDAAAYALSEMILSVKLKRFTAAIQGSEVFTDWVVSDEGNTKGFEVEASTDGVHFRTVSFVSAGNRGHYSATDKNPASGINYYRLKTSSRDNKTSYSNICKVDFNAATGATVYPNPASGSFRLMLRDEMINKSGSLMISTLSGHTVQQRNFAALNQTETIDISQLAAGMYFIRLTVGKNIIHKSLQVIGK